MYVSISVRICIWRCVARGLTFDAEDVHGPLILEPLHGVLHATTAARQGSEHAQNMAWLAYKRATRV
jgi:hypothetical protein